MERYGAVTRKLRYTYVGETGNERDERDPPPRLARSYGNAKRGPSLRSNLVSWLWWTTGLPS